MSLPEWWPSDEPYIIGDCLEGMRQLPDKCVDLVLTDPPYGINFQSNGREVKFDKIYNDDNLDWLNDFIYETNRILKDNTHFYCFCHWSKIGEFQRVITDYFTIKNILVVPSIQGATGDLKGQYSPNYEMCIFAHTGRKEFNDVCIDMVSESRLNDSRYNGDKYIKRYPSLLLDYYATEHDTKLSHPFQKNIKLIQLFIQLSCDKGGVVLDPFLGSGTTLRACRETGRVGLGFEINPDYEAVIRKRMMADIPKIEGWFD